MRVQDNVTQRVIKSYTGSALVSVQFGILSIILKGLKYKSLHSFNLIISAIQICLYVIISENMPAGIFMATLLETGK